METSERNIHQTLLVNKKIKKINVRFRYLNLFLYPLKILPQSLGCVPVRVSMVFGQCGPQFRNLPKNYSFETGVKQLITGTQSLTICFESCFGSVDLFGILICYYF